MSVYKCIDMNVCVPAEHMTVYIHVCTCVYHYNAL